jgi:hypothetical protein
MRGHGFLPCVVLSRHVGLGGVTLLGDTRPPTLDACGDANFLDTSIIDFDIECMALYQGMLALHWNYYGAYACIPGRVTITDSDGMGPRTQVYAARHAWAPVAVPYLHQVMNACFSRGRGANRAYPVHGSPRVRWLDAQVPPGSR